MPWQPACHNKHGNTITMKVIIKQLLLYKHHNCQTDKSFVLGNVCKMNNSVKYLFINMKWYDTIKCADNQHTVPKLHRFNIFRKSTCSYIENHQGQSEACLVSFSTISSLSTAGWIFACIVVCLHVQETDCALSPTNIAAALQGLGQVWSKGMVNSQLQLFFFFTWYWPPSLMERSHIRAKYSPSRISWSALGLQNCLNLSKAEVIQSAG